ncbi:homocysteine S-methyltransferase family protein [Candidatus Aerophobetes bacterium]|nr:homocysteine S-methyltransferase family protein [Candidatus Aerophobetes bacterium]
MNFRELLEEKKIIFFDGAMGTSLEPYLSPGELPENLNLSSPEKVKNVHLSYVKAGADVIETNTFGANRLKLERAGLDDKIKEVNFFGVKIAREAACNRLVGASVGPLGELVRPWGNITGSQAFEIFKEQIEILAEAGADIIVIETMMSLKEAKIAAVAASQVCDLPIVCQLTFDERGKTLIGTGPQVAVLTLEAVKVDVIGANCSTGPDRMFPIARIMLSSSKLPLIFQPNAGKPYLEEGKTRFPMGPEEFSLWMRKFVQSGARIVGGCCGTTPSHIQQMIEKIGKIEVSFPLRKDILKGLSSRTQNYYLDRKKPLLLGVNISAEDFKDQNRLLEIIAKAEQAGCSFLNITLRDINTDFNTELLINTLQQNTALGITIDTENPAILEEALREFEGKPLVFLEKEDDNLLKIAEKWGADVGFNVHLDNKKSAAKNTREILEKCREKNFKNPMVRVIFSPFIKKDYAVKEDLEEIQKILKEYSFEMIFDLANFSCKVPGGLYLTGFVLGVASWMGVVGAILDPSQVNSSLILRAAEALCYKDKEGKNFITSMGDKNEII